MSAGVTFGSFGDIITICIIIKDLVKALDDSRGSSAEYQEVIRELWALDRVLLQVELLWRTCESTVELNALRETAHRMTDQCRQSIEAFIKKVKKYGPSLRNGGSGNVVRDATMKIRWQATHAQDLTKFRAEINAHCSAINMLLLTASVNLNKLSDNRLYARLSLNEGKMETSSQEQQRLLDDFKNKLEENNQQIRAGNASIQKLSEVLRLDWVRQLGKDLKTFMRKIFVMNIATYKAVLDIRGCLPSHLERSLYQEPFILEDAIGRIAPVHMQFINSWEAFDSVLELRFLTRQALALAVNYVLTSHKTLTFNALDVAPLRKPREEVAVFGKTSFSMVVFGPPPPDHLAAFRKRKREDNDITLFKRVRLLSKETRIRKIKHISEPFTELAAKRNGFTKIAASNANEGITSKSLSSMSSQPPKTSFVTRDFEKPMTESIPSAFSNIISVPRTTNSSDVDDTDDDSDDGGDDSDDGRNDRHYWGDNRDDLGNDRDDGGKDSELLNLNHNKKRRINYRDSNGVEYLKHHHEKWPENEYPLFLPPLSPPTSPTPQKRRLHEAINRDDASEVLRLLDSEVDVECHWGTTPICRAVQMGNQVIIGTLLAKGANVNRFGLAGWEGLIKAADKGDSDRVALLLSHGANVEIKSHHVGTALQIASAKGHPVVVQMLLDHGAKFSTSHWPRLIELQLAVLNGHVAVVRLLLERGADITVKDAFGSTLLHMAAESNVSVPVAARS